MTPAKMIGLGVLLLILIPMVVVDLRERRIPNMLNALLALAGLAFQAATAPSFTAVLLSLIAPVAIISVFLGLIALMKLLRRPGTLGLGDVKFLAAASIWVGFVGSTVVFIIASLLALGFALVRAPWNKLDLKRAIPFCPFLAIGLALIFAASAPLYGEPASPVSQSDPAIRAL